LRDFFDILGDSRRPRSGMERSPAVDRILTKIKASGLNSLSAQEREILQRESAAARRSYAD